jgi:dephospho-CoA kinase
MIIGVCGTIAAGKETLTGFFREKGFVYFETSAILKEMLTEKGLEITRENMQNLGDELRKKDGAGAIMKIMLEGAKKDPTKNYLFDSLRNPGEAEFLKKNCANFALIGVDAPKGIRFERILQRGKPYDPKTWEEFLNVDERDLNDEENPLGQHTAQLLKIADFIIINNKDLESATSQIEHIYDIIKENNAL